MSRSAIKRLRRNMAGVLCAAGGPAFMNVLSSCNRGWRHGTEETIEVTQLAVDTHGYTDFAMALARLLGFDLCPRLRELKQQHLFVPRGTKVPEELAAVCEAGIDPALIEGHWDTLVHLAASVSSGHSSAVTALARFGSGRPEEVTRSTTPACSWASCCARRSWLTTSSTPASAGSCVACSTAARRSTR